MLTATQKLGTDRRGKMFRQANATWWRDHEKFGDYENPKAWLEDVKNAIPPHATRQNWIEASGDRCAICGGKIRRAMGGIECSDAHCPAHDLEN